MVVWQRMAMFLVSMRQTDSFMHEIDGFDVSMKERHTTQQLADRADDIGDIEIARRDLVQHRGEEEKVIAIDESHVQVVSLRKRSFEFQRGIHAAKPATQNQHSWLPARHKSSSTREVLTLSFHHPDRKAFCLAQ